MVSLTLSVSDDIKQEMDNFPDINWSAVAREAIQKRIIMLHKFKEFTKNSDFTDEDTLKLSRELNKKLAKRHQ